MLKAAAFYALTAAAVAFAGYVLLNFAKRIPVVGNAIGKVAP